MGIGTIFLVIIVLLILYCISLYNGLVRKNIETKNAWSQIDVQLKRRHDLIPNLIETVKGYAGHERQTLEAVTAARNTAMGAAGQGVASQAAAENMLTQTLRSLFALQEAYPDLKANQNFLSLQEELSSTENRIGFARQHYNDSVGTYNTAIQSFPAVLFASSFGFIAREFFELDATEAQAAREVPKVQF